MFDLFLWGLKNWGSNERCLNYVSIGCLLFLSICFWVCKVCAIKGPYGLCSCVFINLYVLLLVSSLVKLGNASGGD